MTSSLSKTARSCRFALHNIRKISSFRTQHAAQLLVQALVISRLRCSSSWTSIKHNQTSTNDSECSGTTGLQRTQKSPCYTSLCLLALAPGCSSHPVQDTDACIQNNHRLSTLLLPLTITNLHPLQKPRLLPLTDDNLHPLQKPRLLPLTDDNLHPLQKPRLLPLTDDNLHPLQKPEICEWATPRGTITERHKITFQNVLAHRSWLVEWTSHLYPDRWIPVNLQATLKLISFIFTWLLLLHFHKRKHTFALFP